MKLEEIAALTNVSVTTVSRALSGKGRISEATRQRVLAAAEGLGYRPSAAGRALVTGRCETIGIVMETAYRVHAEWGLRIQAGVSEALGKRNHQTMVLYTKPGESTMPSIVLNRAVDGVVIVLSSAPRFLEELRRRRMPVVVADPAGPVDCDSVRADEEDGARQATKHLLALGHRRIAYLGTRSPEVEHVHRQRWKGFVQVMSDAGLPINPSSDRIDPPEQLLARVLEWQTPTALVCFNDFVATAAIGRLRELGLETPRDVSVVGFDDMSYLAYARPHQTTVHIPYEEMGAEAAELVLRRVETPDAPTRHVVLPEKLIARDSTARPVKKSDIPRQ